MASTTTGEPRGREHPGRLRVAGRDYVVLPVTVYRRLARLAREPHRDAVAYARESIGREIARRRRAARLSQTAVALRAGIRVETLSRLENGRSNPTVKTVRAILRALGR
ncbi:MAG: helix-turn-helix transcriptional regulator [Gemmatimonadota bacterium]